VEKHFGIECHTRIQRTTPTGLGGDATVVVNPLKESIKPISILERGEVSYITGIIWNPKDEYKTVRPH